MQSFFKLHRVPFDVILVCRLIFLIVCKPKWNFQMRFSTSWKWYISADDAACSNSFPMLHQVAGIISHVAHRNDGPNPTPRLHELYQCFWFRGVSLSLSIEFLAWASIVSSISAALEPTFRSSTYWPERVGSGAVEITAAHSPNKSFPSDWTRWQPLLPPLTFWGRNLQAFRLHARTSPSLQRSDYERQLSIACRLSITVSCQPTQ